MIKNIYVVKHGQTDWNVKELFQGITDIKLNETGINEAKNVSEKLKDISFDVIVSSPLKRAYETAEEISKINECKNLKVDEHFIARSFGEAEGTPISNYVVNHKIVDDFEEQITLKGAQSMESVINKIVEGMNYYLKSEYHNILIATHTQILKAIAIWYDTERYRKPNDFYIGNCGVMRLVFDDTKFVKLEVL